MKQLDRPDTTVETLRLRLGKFEASASGRTAVLVLAMAIVALAAVLALFQS